MSDKKWEIDDIKEKVEECVYEHIQNQPFTEQIDHDETWGDGFMKHRDETCKSFTIVMENGQKFKVSVEEV